MHEAAPPADGLGAWLTLAANGLDALAPLGVAGQVQAAGFATSRMTMRTATGRQLVAFEDAVTLARCLRDRPSVPDALRAYEALRRRRVEAVVRRGKRTGDAKAPGPVGRWVRDRVAMPLLARHLARTTRRDRPPDAWLTGHHVDGEEPVRV